MIIILFKFFFRGFDVDYLRLIDEDCMVIENEIYFFFIISIFECGIVFKYNSDYVIYSNMVLEILFWEN